LSNSLACQFDSLWEIQQSTILSLKQVQGIDQEVAHSIFQWFKVDENILMTRRLERYGVQVRKVNHDSNAGRGQDERS